MWTAAFGGAYALEASREQTREPRAPRARRRGRVVRRRGQPDDPFVRRRLFHRLAPPRCLQSTPATSHTTRSSSSRTIAHHVFTLCAIAICAYTGHRYTLVRGKHYSKGGRRRSALCIQRAPRSRRTRASSRSTRSRASWLSRGRGASSRTSLARGATCLSRSYSRRHKSRSRRSSYGSWPRSCAALGCMRRTRKSEIL